MNSKKIILAWITFLPFFCSGQDWNLVKMNQKYHYMHDTSDVVYTIWVDSTFSGSNDTTYYLNRVAALCDTCQNLSVPSGCFPVFYLLNQPQFLGLSVIDNDTAFILSGNDRCILKDDTSGQVWDFDPALGITASTVFHGIQQVFGNDDSVKVILLNGLDSLVISKTFGIIKYPAGNGQYFRLTGTEGDSAAGLRVPGAKEMFLVDSNITLCYYAHALDPGRNWEVTMNFHIVEQEWDTLYNLYCDSVQGFATGVVYWVDWPGAVWDWLLTYPTNDPFSDVFNFPFYNTGSFNDAYTGQVIDELYRIVIPRVRYANGHFYKESVDTTGYTHVSGYDNLIVLCEQWNSDWLNVKIKEGLGYITYISGFWEGGETWKLLWYSRQGDTTFLTERKPVEMASGTALWPNPAHDYFRINNHESVEEIFVTDFWGRHRLSFSGNFSQPLNISPLEPGMYLVLIRELNGKSIVRKLIKSK